MEPEVLESIKGAINENMKQIVSPITAKQEEMEKKFEEQEKKLKEYDKKIEALAEMEFNSKKKSYMGNDLAWKDAFGGVLHKALAGEVGTVHINETKGLITDSKGVTLTDLGGAIPQQWIPEVFKIDPDAGAFMRSNPRIIPIAQVTNMAKENTRPSITWKSKGAGEGAEAGDTKGTTTGVTVTRDRCIATIKLSNESLLWSNIALLNYFTETLRIELNKDLDKQAFINNANPFTGVFYASGVTTYQLAAGKTSFADVDWTDIRKIRRKVKSSVLGTCNWITSNTVMGLFETIHDDNNRPIYDQVTDKLANHPALITEVMPEDSDDAANTDFAIFGSGRKGHVLGTGGFQVGASEHADYEHDNIILRVTMDAAMLIILGGAYVKIKTAAT